MISKKEKIYLLEREMSPELFHYGKILTLCLKSFYFIPMEQKFTNRRVI